MSKQAKKSLLIALLLSLLLVHLPLFVFLWKMQDFGRVELKPLNPKPEMVMVDLREMPTLPMADIDRPAHEEVPDKPSVQSLYNSKVKEETVTARTSRKTEPLGNAQTAQPQVAPRPNVQKPPVSAPPKQEKQAKAPDASPAKTSSTTAMPALLPKPEEKMPHSQTSLQDELRALQNREQSKEQQKLARFNSNTTFPTNLGSPLGGSAGDYLPNYTVGNRTYLNALANPHIGYFVELKRKFKFAWNPVPALRSQLNQITKGKIEVVWGVTVDAGGRIQDLVLIRSSGLSAYDAEAKRTITASSPFTSPPANLLKEDHQLHMAWTFVVYL